MHRSVVFMAVVAMVPVLATGAAVAKDEPVGKGKESERAATGSAGAKDKLADKGKGMDRVGDKRRGTAPEQVTYVFKGSVAQDGEEGSPLKVKVDKRTTPAGPLSGNSWSSPFGQLPRFTWTMQTHNSLSWMRGLPSLRQGIR